MENKVTYLTTKQQTLPRKSW